MYAAPAKIGGAPERLSLIHISLPPTVLRSAVLEMKDLKPEMELTGTVRNVVDFGAVVDSGVHEDGLVHISQIGEKYVKPPGDVLKVGDIVRVKVLEVDQKLSLIHILYRIGGRRGNTGVSLCGVTLGIPPLKC